MAWIVVLSGVAFRIRYVFIYSLKYIFMITTMQEEIKRVLKKSKIPLTSKQIAEEIKKRGHYKFRGATPNSSVCARIITDIKRNGEKSIYKKTEKGFIIK